MITCLYRGICPANIFLRPVLFANFITIYIASDPATRGETKLC